MLLVPLVGAMVLTVLLLPGGIQLCQQILELRLLLRAQGVKHFEIVLPMGAHSLALVRSGMSVAAKQPHQGRVAFCFLAHFRCFPILGRFKVCLSTATSQLVGRALIMTLIAMFR